MFLLYLIGWCLCTPVPELTPDGYGLVIKGEGSVTQAITREKGSFSDITSLEIINATNLESSAFLDFKSVLTVKMTNTIQSIGSQCFKNCYKLQCIVIPEGVEVLEHSTFYSCNELKNITLPSSLKIINTNGLFLKAKNLQKFYFSGDNAYFSTDITNSYLMSRNGTVLYKGPSSSDIIIPATVKTILLHFSYDCLMKSISFKGSSLEELRTSIFVSETIDVLNITNTIKRIESGFYNGQINRIIVPDSVEYFDKEALKYITGIESLEIGDHSKVLKKNSNGIIFDIDGTSIIFIPKTTTVLEMEGTVTSVTVSQVKSTNIEYVNVTGTPGIYSSFYGVLYKGNGAELYACPGGMKNVKVVENCTTILDSSFSRCLVETIEMSDCVTEFRFAAFELCSKLRSLNIPSKLQIIGNWVFRECSQLTSSISFPSSLQGIGSSSFYQAVFKSLDFSQCQFTSIGENTFYNSRIESIKLPRTLKSISQQAFILCSTLTEVEIPISVETIGKSAFQSCKSLSKVAFTGSSYLVIAESTFESCTSLNHIDIPDSVEVISSGAFRSCSSLKSINFGDNSKLKKIGFGIIADCSNLETFTIPKSVEEIEPGAFHSSSGLINFEVADGNSVFKGRNGVLFLKENATLYVFPGGRSASNIAADVVAFAPMAFRYCLLLQNVTFSDGCQIGAVGAYTFDGCAKLESIELPGSVRSIEMNAFSGCTNLANVVFGEDSALVELSAAAFSQCANLRAVRFAGASKLSAIGSGALRGCERLAVFEIPGTVRVIGDSAFEGCRALEQAAFGGTESLGARAFFGCEKLESIILPPSLSLLGDSAFGECKRLSAIRCCSPDGIKAGSNCFVGVTAKVVFVPIYFEESVVFDLRVVRVLDQNCMVPTNAFTFAAGGIFGGSISDVLMLGSAVLSSEGGKSEV